MKIQVQQQELLWFSLFNKRACLLSFEINCDGEFFLFVFFTYTVHKFCIVLGVLLHKYVSLSSQSDSTKEIISSLDINELPLSLDLLKNT